MSALELFYFDGAEVRVIVIDGEPWFVARDVASRIGYTDTTNAIKQHCKGVAKHHPIVDALGRTQSARVIAEPDLLRLIVNSKLPSAERFERLVFEEILPAIRRTGSYGTPALTDDEIMHRALSISARRVEALESKVAEDAPKVAAYDALIDADGYYSMESVAKLGGIGRTTLFRRLRDAGVIMSDSRLPYQRYMPWFKITTATWGDPKAGPSGVSATARVLPSALTKVLAKAGVTLEAVPA